MESNPDSFSATNMTMDSVDNVRISIGKPMGSSFNIFSRPAKSLYRIRKNMENYSIYKMRCGIW